jgi:hypothetical protein
MCRTSLAIAVLLVPSCRKHEPEPAASRAAARPTQSGDRDEVLEMDPPAVPGTVFIDERGARVRYANPGSPIPQGQAADPPCPVTTLRATSYDPPTVRLPGSDPLSGVYEPDMRIVSTIRVDSPDVHQRRMRNCAIVDMQVFAQVTGSLKSLRMSVDTGPAQYSVSLKSRFKKVVESNRSHRSYFGDRLIFNSPTYGTALIQSGDIKRGEGLGSTCSDFVFADGGSKLRDATPPYVGTYAPSNSFSSHLSTAQLSNEWTLTLEREGDEPLRLDCWGLAFTLNDMRELK